MAGESVLIVDGAPVDLKLTRIVLSNEGFQTLAAAGASEALELLKTHRPRLALVRLPDAEALDLARKIRRASPGTAIIALAVEGGGQRAVDAGFDGYIPAPIDTRTLAARVRGFLERPAPAKAIPAADMHSLRQRFLNEGRTLLGRFLADLDGRFPTAEAATAVHQWSGTSGLLGYTEIGRLARVAEAVLAERPLDSGSLRDALEGLALAFRNPPSFE